MNDFFGTNLTQQDLQQRLAQRRQSGKIHQLHNRPSPQSPQPQLPQTDTQSQQQPGVKLSSSSQNGSPNLGQMNGDSLDDIIMQNTREVNRRQTSDNYHFGNATPGQPHDRRLSMMEFSAGIGNMGPMYPSNANTAGATAQDSNRRHSNGDISLGGNGFPNMPPISTQGLSNPLQATDALNMNTNNIYNMSPDVMNNLMNFADVDLDAMGDESDELNMFGMQNFSQQFPGSHLPGMTGDLDFTMPLTSAPGMSNLTSMTGMGNQGNGMMNMPTGSMGMTQSQLDMNNTLDGYTSPNPTAMTTIPSNQGFNPSLPVSGPPPPKQEPPSTFSGVYSSSGFDMLGALMRVATRKNPEINIGAVDMSCAFVVCDLTLDDCPIIYVSEIFERLTGYSKHEVLGRNCRFLQAPDGKVTSGMKRKYVDDESVYYLKSRISEQKEAQRSLINYRKGGQPFMNLLTMIPITWDSDEFKYIVGFQVDLVEQPSSVAGRGSGGSYTVNYSQKMLPAYVWHPPESRFQPEVGNTISRDEVSAVLSSYHKKNDSELMKRMWDKVLLENTDDVVHVLSLKGLFLYLSPASRQVLEYDPAELVGTALSSICHPSDIVPVTRELKDTTAGAPVNVVYRIRRKNSGYTWFESHGTLCVEQGKGRKCIILVGRERPVYALARHDIEAAGGIGENELWSKLSTSGMFLFISSNVRILLDRQPEELVGTSIQAIMRAESKVEFGRTLERARTGMRTVFKHEVLNRRGQVLQAQTTLYPGDAAEGSKPTFLVCQTRLIKSSSRSSVTPLTSSNTNKSVASGHSSDHDANLSVALSGSSNLSGASNGDPGTIVTHAGGAALPIGTQEEALASEDNIFDELKTTRSTSWQFELRQMEKVNRLLSEELSSLLSNKKKRKRRKGSGNTQRDCANCHTRTTPEWRRGPSGQRDLCNSCGLRWAKQNGRVSPRNSSRTSTSDPGKHSASSVHSSPLHKEQTSATVLPATASGANTPGNASVDLTAASTSPQARSTGQSVLTDIDELSEP